MLFCYCGCPEFIVALLIKLFQRLNMLNMSDRQVVSELYEVRENENMYPEKAVLSNYLFLAEVDIPDNTYHHLIYSPLSGTLDFLDDDTASYIKRLIKEGRVLNMDSQLGKQLWDRGYLFEDYDAEQRQSEMLYHELLKFNRDIQRHQLSIIPTYTCNLDCVYCWQDRRKLPGIIMDAGTVGKTFEAIDQLVSGIDPENVDICLFGGEPLQADDNVINAVKHIVEQSRSRGFRLKAISNGVNLREYIPLFGGCLDVVQVTLDGTEEIHESRRRGNLGDFWKIIQSIDHALESGISVNIRVNVEPENIQSISDLAMFVSNRWGTNAPNLYLSPVKGGDIEHQYNGLETVKQILQMLASNEMPKNVDLSGYRPIRDVEYIIRHDKAPLQRFFNCEAQLNFWALDPVGDIYACYDACGNPGMAVGRFLPALDLDETKLGKWRSHSSLNKEKCRSCAAAPLCSGGCVYVEASHEKHSCDMLMDYYPVVLSYYSRKIYDIAAGGKSRTIGFICS